ncbi:ISAs1 family transposase [Synechocystis sp. PCC 7509]|uniref:ISAs1 family transposase n=1 Tax=Synechocystis sp. PCC 7509 TaxID=927677 RepID=UPI0002AC68BF|nr:ISAs1 family transposase [Synechocystis sp. PCC 7509]
MPCTAKKTTKLIIEGGNDYVITVKANQPRLLAQLKTKTEHQKPCHRFVDVEKIRGRTTCRIVQVFTELKSIALDWVGVQSLVQVERIGIHSGKRYLQTNYYISSLVSKATTFAAGIRQHWGIENRLHWVKDVILGKTLPHSLTPILSPIGLLSALLPSILLECLAMIL